MPAPLKDLIGQKRNGGADSDTELQSLADGAGLGSQGTSASSELSEDTQNTSPFLRRISPHLQQVRSLTHTQLQGGTIWLPGLKRMTMRFTKKIHPLSSQKTHISLLKRGGMDGLAQSFRAMEGLHIALPTNSPQRALM